MFNLKLDKVTLPNLDEESATKEQYEIYSRFMGHLRHVPISREELKVLAAIQFCADMMNFSDAYIAKELVEMGLRAPRMAFPMEFLYFADRTSLRKGWEVGAPSGSLSELLSSWITGKEQLRLSSFRHVGDVVEEEYA